MKKFIELIEKDYRSILVLLSLIEARDAEGWTPLASAAFTYNEALCEFLLANGCTLCLDTSQKEHLKSQLSCRIHDATRVGSKTALQLLLDMGADINERNSYGETALLEAVSNNNLSCVKILIKRGADATISTTGGESILHRAAWRSIGSDMMKFLLEHVAETQGLVNAKDTDGDTPLHDCSRNNHEASEHARVLLKAGASITIKNNAAKTPYRCARDQKRKELTSYLWSLLSPEQKAQEEPLFFNLVR
ncbi:ankyrin [Terfezia boudieri ATCC MYA-4762]|uniref:Ankyrin n=1 Tax=Terfezia boudieri ATCC MYA-4762 TaxID=1051890 RepID=A0A3N4LPZ8_9PEZI|nr:ankyrin [Terfezia boudieri ATCC MYA-4762]